MEPMEGKSGESITEAVESAPKKSLFLMRRRYLINRPLQLGLTGFFAVVGLINTAALYLAHRIMSTKIVEAIQIVETDQKGFLLGALSELERNSSLAFVVYAILLFVYLLVMGVLLSHKVAGPVFVIQRQIRRLLQGDYDGTVKLRKHDFLSDVAEDINRLTEKLRAEGGPRPTSEEDKAPGEPSI
ncbi:MAG: cell wall metabolism sensor histidine kinase WalK [Oligoflexia bacterium]|nr:cell wall metabolism sensor histidine kinase WalK [Oligoflexia bacterium]